MVRMTSYLLVCRECGNGDLVMPFESAAARGKWAAAHTHGTGHDRWYVKDESLIDAVRAYNRRTQEIIDPGRR